MANVDTSGVDPNYDVIVLPACGCKPAKNLTADNPADDDDPRYSPDGRYLAFMQQRIPRLRRRSLPSHAARSREPARRANLTEDWDRSVTEPAWLPDSRSLIASIDDAATRRVYRFERHGRRARNR